MASSDDEEIVPQTVTNYYFVDDDESPVSFSVVPFYFDDGGKQEAGGKAVFLHGTSDGGLQKVYKQVVGWKLGLEDQRPKIAVLSKDNKWIDILKPRKSYYENTIRSIMITAQLLHFLRKKPQASEKSLWEHVYSVFSTFEVRPSDDDINLHLPLVKLLKEKDEILANSPLLNGFLEGKTRKRSIEDTHDSLYVKQSFIAEDDEVDESAKDVEDGDNSDEESDLFDSVCAICDNGGDILCCEGPCLRSFHPTKESGEESKCKSLGYTSKANVDLIQNFLCNNCFYKQHQCFACGKLGSADVKCAEVYPCVSATCGHFYHPKCVAELLFPGNEAKASELQKNIIAGESFTCPVHKCVVCKQGEDKEVKDLQFAMCRRCPKSYHRKCLPRRIAFDYIEDEDIIVRAWDGLLPSRVLIYCLEHQIDEEIGTPIRNHIIFPENPEKKRNSDTQKSEVKLLPIKKKPIGGMTRYQTTTKPVEVISSDKIKAKEKDTRSIVQHALGSQKKERPLKGKSPFEMGKVKLVLGDSKITAKEEKPTTSSMDKTTRSTCPIIDSETEALTYDIFDKVSSTIRLEDITRKHSMPSTHSSSKHIDRNVTLGRIEASVEAIRTALHKLENGASVEDAKAVCEPELLKQVVRWREKLRVYLAPFLHGMHYSSFGRHFTKLEKLKEIVEKIQWYVQDGDTVVDFCCGANDFSILMKKKLDAAGKKCNFKNYDIIQPKNDFNFERRDWMTVNTKELPTGSKLIMGLNPPFGVKAALANKFIEKALRFKPKLLVLVVPEETERLDKKSSYDLIWKDGQSLSGKSFYLPGSTDANDKQIEQWNNSPPPLYLWSRSDYTTRHKEIATRHGHISSDQEEQEQEQVQVLLPSEQESIVELLAHVVAEDQLAQDIRDATSSGMQARKEDDSITENETERVAYSENHNNGSRKRRKPTINENISEERMHDDGSDLDMDISPGHGQPENRNWSSHPPSEMIATSLGGPSKQDACLNSGTEPNTIAGGNDIYKDIVNDIDEIARRYTSPAAGESMLQRSSHGWPSGGLDSYDYGGILASDSHFSDYARDKPESFGRSSYFGDVGVYGRSSEADLRAQIRLYGPQDQNEQYLRNRNPFGGLDAGGYGPQSRPMSSSAFGHSPASSAMDRYPARFSETSFVRPTNHAPVGPFPGRGTVYEHNMHGMRRDMPPDFSGFATGPHPSFNHPGSSAGWLND